MIQRHAAIVVFGAVLALVLLATQVGATVGGSCCKCTGCNGPLFCESQDPFNQADCDAFCVNRQCTSGTAQRDDCELDPQCTTQDPQCCVCLDCPGGMLQCGAISSMLTPEDCGQFCFVLGCPDGRLSIQSCASSGCPTAPAAPAPALTPWALGVVIAVLAMIGVRRLTHST